MGPCSKPVGRTAQRCQARLLQEQAAEWAAKEPGPREQHQAHAMPQPA